MEENAPNVNVVVTQQPVFKQIFKIVLILLFFIVLTIGLLLYFSKKKTAQNANNQPEKNTTVALPAGVGGGGGSATVPAQTPVNAEASSALEAKIVDISNDTVSFETISHELIILSTSKITNGSYMVLNTPVKLILTKSTKDGTIIKVEVTKLSSK